MPVRRSIRNDEPVNTTHSEQGSMITEFTSELESQAMVPTFQGQSPRSRYNPWPGVFIMPPLIMVPIDPSMLDDPRLAPWVRIWRWIRRLIYSVTTAREDNARAARIQQQSNRILDLMAADAPPVEVWEAIRQLSELTNGATRTQADLESEDDNTDSTMAVLFLGNHTEDTTLQEEECRFQSRHFYLD